MWRKGLEKKQLKFNVYVTSLCSCFQHLECCLEERDKALYCPPLWTCNGFSLCMIQAHCFHVPQVCPSIHGSTAVYLLKGFHKKWLTQLSFISGLHAAKVVLAQTTLLSLLSCSCKKYLPYYHQGSASCRENKDVKFHQTSSIFHPSSRQQFPLDTWKEKNMPFSLSIDGCWLVKWYDGPCG